MLTLGVPLLYCMNNPSLFFGLYLGQGQGPIQNLSIGNPIKYRDPINVESIWVDVAVDGPSVLHDYHLFFVLLPVIREQNRFKSYSVL